MSRTEAVQPAVIVWLPDSTPPFVYPCVFLLRKWVALDVCMRSGWETPEAFLESENCYWLVFLPPKSLLFASRLFALSIRLDWLLTCAGFSRAPRFVFRPWCGYTIVYLCNLCAEPVNFSSVLLFMEFLVTWGL